MGGLAQPRVLVREGQSNYTYRQHKLITSRARLRATVVGGPGPAAKAQELFACVGGGHGGGCGDPGQVDGS